MYEINVQIIHLCRQSFYGFCDTFSIVMKLDQYTKYTDESFRLHPRYLALEIKVVCMNQKGICDY